MLNKGGETGKLIQEYDWAASPIGESEYWPQSLLITLSIMLPSAVPMFLLWGKEYIFFCNDAFTPCLGNEHKHSSIGKKGEEVWMEIWQDIKPLINDVRIKNEAARLENIRLKMYKDNGVADTWWTFNYSPILNEEGAANGVLAICTEMTPADRQKIEELDTKNKLAIESANLGSYEINLLTDEMVTSERFTAIWGADHRTMPRSEFVSFIHPDDRQLRRQAHKEALVTGQLYYEARIIWKDASIHWVRVNGKVLFDSSGTAHTLLGIIQDITEQMITQQRKDNFIAMASHELRTPLTTIKAYAQIIGIELTRRNLVKEFQMIDKIDNQINNLNKLVADLLNISKIDSGKLEHERNNFNINECITKVTEEMQLTTTKHKIHVSLARPVTVYADRNRIGQVITNFISNAIKYSPDSNLVNVETRINNDEVILSVEDFGIGISEQEQELVFEQFYRVNNPKHQSFSGMGLGLYICDAILKREGGKLWVKSEENKGSTFYFSLPIASINK